MAWVIKNMTSYTDSTTKDEILNSQSINIKTNRPLPDWFRELSCKCINFDGTYPRDILIDSLDKCYKCTVSVYMENDEILDFGCNYSPKELTILSDTYKIYVTIMNASNTEKIQAYGCIRLKLINCLNVTTVYSDHRESTLTFHNSQSRNIKELVGNYEEINGLSHKVCIRNMTRIPRTILPIGTIILYDPRNYNETYRYSLNYKKIRIVYNPDKYGKIYDLSIFEIDKISRIGIELGECYNLPIYSDSWPQIKKTYKIILPKISNIEILVIEEEGIADALDLSNVGHIHHISLNFRVKNEYKIGLDVLGKLLEHCSMITMKYYGTKEATIYTIDDYIKSTNNVSIKNANNT